VLNGPLKGVLPPRVSCADGAGVAGGARIENGSSLMAFIAAASPRDAFSHAAVIRAASPGPIDFRSRE
jgi:hypothetical protein